MVRARSLRDEYAPSWADQPADGCFQIGLDPTPRIGLTAIYGLRDQFGEVRYIGKTTKPRRRLIEHWRSPKGGIPSPVSSWCRKLKVAGHLPVMDVVAWVCDWEPVERYFIGEARRLGYRLLNLADGGINRRFVRSPCPALSHALRFAQRQTVEPGLLRVIESAMDRAIADDDMEEFDLVMARALGGHKAAKLGYFPADVFNDPSLGMTRKRALEHIARGERIPN